MKLYWKNLLFPGSSTNTLRKPASKACSDPVVLRLNFCLIIVGSNGWSFGTRLATCVCLEHRLFNMPGKSRKSVLAVREVLGKPGIHTRYKSAQVNPAFLPDLKAIG